MKRRLAREIAVQALYHMEMNNSGTEAAIRMAAEESEENGAVDQETLSFSTELSEGVSGNRSRLDEMLTEYLKGWKMDRLSKVDRQILRLGVFEMLYSEDVPPKVAINEAIDLAKHFGDEESGKFVNGVLGKMIHDLQKLKEKIKETI